MTSRDVLRVVIYALASYRLARLVSIEEGPFDIFTRIRARLGVVTQQNPQGEWITWSDSLLGKLVACPYCLSGWFSLIAVIFVVLDIVWIDIAALWLAIWAVATILYSVDRTM